MNTTMAPRWLRRRLIFGVAIALALIAAACGADKPSTTDPLSNVPGEPFVLVSARVDHLLADPDVRDIVDALIAAADRIARSDEIPDFEGVVALIEEKTGIDLTKVEEIMFFASAGTGSRGEGAATSTLEDLTDGEGAVFLRGEFDLPAVLAALEQSNDEPFATEGYKGQTLHVSDDDVAIAFLELDLLVLGPASTIRSIVDVRVGDRPGATGPAVEAFKVLDAELAKVVVAPPPGALREAIDGEDGLPFTVDLSALTELRAVAFSLDKKVTLFEAKTTLVYADEATASRSKAIIDGLRGLASVLITSPDLSSVLKGVVVTAKGSRVEIVTRLRAREIQDLIGQLEALLAIASAETIFGSGEERPEAPPRELSPRFGSIEVIPEKPPPVPVLTPRSGSTEAIRLPPPVPTPREAR